MNRDPQSDHSPVYQNSNSDHEPDSGAGRVTADSSPDLGRLIQKCLAHGRPRLFALLDATGDEDPAPDNEPTPQSEPVEASAAEDDVSFEDSAASRDDAVEAASELVVAWGMEFPDRAVVCLRNPYTGRTTFSVHSTAERARLLYQRVGPLHLVFPS